MAEKERRASVKVFRHKTDYNGSGQRNLVDASLNEYSGMESMCSLKYGVIPPNGTPVIVRVGAEGTLEVLWGNQVIGSVTDLQSGDLSSLIAYTDRHSGLAATAVVHTDADRHFGIRFQ
jgi:hypothetical protein